MGIKCLSVQIWRCPDKVIKMSHLVEDVKMTPNVLIVVASCSSIQLHWMQRGIDYFVSNVERYLLMMTERGRSRKIFDTAISNKKAIIL